MGRYHFNRRSDFWLLSDSHDRIKAAAIGLWDMIGGVLMSTQTTRIVSESDTTYALDLFASLSPADQAEIMALAVSALASPQ